MLCQLNKPAVGDGCVRRPAACALDPFDIINVFGNLRQLLTNLQARCRKEEKRKKVARTGLPITSSNFRQQCWKPSLIWREKKRTGKRQRWSEKRNIFPWNEQDFLTDLLLDWLFWLERRKLYQLAVSTSVKIWKERHLPAVLQHSKRKNTKFVTADAAVAPSETIMSPSSGHSHLREKKSFSCTQMAAEWEHHQAIAMQILTLIPFNQFRELGTDETTALGLRYMRFGSRLQQLEQLTGYSEVVWPRLLVTQDHSSGYKANYSNFYNRQQS
jgi:hypothetical protein